MRNVGKVFVAAVLVASAWAAAPVTEAQRPLRIGASFSGTGTYAHFGQTVHRGYELCVKHANDTGGILGRRIEFTADDDRSDAARSVAIYERLLAQGKVEAVLAPYSTPLTDAEAEVTEKHRMPLVACCMATTSLYRKGRKFIFMFLSRGEVYLEGVIDMAANRGSTRLARIKAANPDVVAAATYFEDAVAITRQLRPSTSTRGCWPSPPAANSRSSTGSSGVPPSSCTAPRPGLLS